ncbi:polysaccharide biosynthesis protein [Lucifera butyrica]|uniref:Polysaccharide biosynthesis protein n=1 Tax=Lucifera butyrica TaxID=1351585 RepID=A0A498RD68_9FIRM|nr:lipopolysaccharide biosynthesis protein [Lucifera butyrica]VBB09401.1 polysaccharide biosynthesis protein [Lucifera butyrica]
MNLGIESRMGNQLVYSRLNNLIRQIVTYIPGSLLPALLALLSTVIFTRIFNVMEYGEYSLVLSTVTFIVALAAQWISQSVNRYLPCAGNMEERAAITETIVFCQSIMVITLLLGGALGFELIPARWKIYYGAGLLLTIGMFLLNTLNSVFQAGMRAREYTVYALANSVLKLVVSLILVLGIQRHPVGMIQGAALGTVVMVPTLWKKLGLTNPLLVLRAQAFRRQWAGFKQFAGYGVPMIGWFLSAQLLMLGDRYIIQMYRGTAEVGIYAANYVLITGAIGLLCAPISLAAHPFLMKAWGDGSREQTAKWLGTITEWFLTVGMLLVCVTWIFSRDIALLFLGQNYRQGHFIMPIILAGLISWQLGIYAHKPLEFAEKTRRMMGLIFLAAGMNLTLNYCLVPRYGYAAAACNSLISFTAYNVMAHISGRRILSWKINCGAILRSALISLAGAWLIIQIRGQVETGFGYLTAFFAAVFSAFVLVGGVIYMNNYFSFLKRKEPDGLSVKSAGNKMPRQ